MARRRLSRLQIKRSSFAVDASHGETVVRTGQTWAKRVCVYHLACARPLPPLRHALRGIILSKGDGQQEALELEYST